MGISLQNDLPLCLHHLLRLPCPILDFHSSLLWAHQYKHSYSSSHRIWSKELSQSLVCHHSSEELLELCKVHHQSNWNETQWELDWEECSIQYYRFHHWLFKAYILCGKKSSVIFRYSYSHVFICMHFLYSWLEIWLTQCQAWLKQLLYSLRLENSSTNWKGMFLSWNSS